MIKANPQYRQTFKKLKAKWRRPVASGRLMPHHEVHFIPERSISEPALKEGFSLPWISSVGLRFNDRLILDGCHYIEVALFVSLIGFIYLVKDKSGWDPVILLALAVTLAIGFYRAFLFERLNKNLWTIAQKAGGKFIPGNIIISAPPSVRFDHEGQDCYVMSVIDQHFRLVLEYSCFFGREAEFRIEKSKEGGGRFIVVGRDKQRVCAALNDPQVVEDLDEILLSFNYLSYGKDGIMHVGDLFDGRLTDPNVVFPTIERMISVGEILRLNEEG